MTTTPVIPATQLLMQLKEKQLCSKETGLALCNRLIEWVSDPSHPDYHEAAMLVFFLAETLRREEVISMGDRDVVFGGGKDAIVKTKIDQVLSQFLSDRGFPGLEATPAEQIPCPVDEINQQFIDLCQKNEEELAHLGKPLFERLIQWITKVEPEEDNGNYIATTITIFCIALELFERAVVDESEKKIMFNRAFQVILRFPERQITNKNLTVFLERPDLLTRV